MTRRYLELIVYKTYADLKAEAARGYLGMLWWVLEPILYMAVFYVVFSVLRHRGEGDFVPFLLVGLVTWKWFASTITQGSRAIEKGAGLMHQVYLPKYIFVCVVACTNLVKFMVVFLLLMLFIVLYGIQPTVAWLTVPLIIAAQLATMLAIAGVLAAITPFLPDLNQLIGNVLTLLFFLSGVMFDIGKAPDRLKPFLYLNPMSGLIENYRCVLIDQQMPGWRYLATLLVLAAMGIAVAKHLMDRFDRVYPKVIVR
jgi:lipopolysaccharide transport system permease protein